MKRYITLSYATLFVSSLTLGACSTVDDIGEAISKAASAANPVNWFDKDEKKISTGEDAEEAKLDAPRITKVAGETTYPKLSSVPEAPKTSTPEQRIIIQEGLLADRANARYADGPPPRLYPKLVTPLAKAPRTPVEEAALTPEIEPGESKEIAKAESVRIVTVRFPENSTKMPDDTVRYLREVVAVQRRYGGTLRIVGHTDSNSLDADPIKDRLAKFNLSIGRANSVASVLVSLGLGRDQLSVEAKGDIEPTAPPGNKARGAENHRVEVYLDRAKN